MRFIVGIGIVLFLILCLAVADSLVQALSSILLELP